MDDTISVRQMKAARALLAWSQGDLAAVSGISEPTIGRRICREGMRFVLRIVGLR
ncbi:MAG: hypothetical protein QOJ86_4430 [Bradyrhizobium sp.]|nr:hypothetical protein [Bradyrhizobium sp.]